MAYDMDSEHDNDEEFMMDITADTEDRTKSKGPAGQSYHVPTARAVDPRGSVGRRETATTLAVLFVAVAITLVVGVFIGVKIVAPPSDQYDYGRMSCWELSDERYQQSEIARNFRDPDVTQEARRRLANAADWYEEKGC